MLRFFQNDKNTVRNKLLRTFNNHNIEISFLIFSLAIFSYFDLK